MLRKPLTVVPVAFAFGLALCGCGGGDLPELGLVSGTVTFDGQPLTGVEVAFHPVDGRPAFGTTNAEGNYTLRYTPGAPGCKVGKNRVTIGNAEGSGEDSELEGDELVQTGADKQPAIPGRYNVNSEIERQVSAGENTFDFQLTSEPDPKPKRTRQAGEEEN
jgi:hypothetical protein